MCKHPGKHNAADNIKIACTTYERDPLKFGVIMAHLTRDEVLQSGEVSSEYRKVRLS